MPAGMTDRTTLLFHPWSLLALLVLLLVATPLLMSCASAERAPKAATAQPAAARPDCNPPYVTDERGQRRAIPECL
jgi:hypothetical protein